MKLTTSNVVTGNISVSRLTIGNTAVVESLNLGNVNFTPSAVTVGNVSITPTAISTPELVVGGVSYSGGQWGGIINYQEFTANGTWYNPYVNASVNAAMTGNEQVFVMMWGGGGSAQAAGGAKLGGGGAFNMGMFRIADLNSTETVTVGIGGLVSVGQNGTSSVFKGLTAYGGGVGLTGAQGGGGGGVLGPSPSNGVGGPPLGGASGNSTGLGGGTSTFGGGGSNGGISIFGGGGGQRASNDPAGNSVYGGAGGVDGASGVASSISVFGGNGANSSTAAGIPGGGGGVSPNGNGARGEVRVWTFGVAGTTLGAPTYTLTANTTTLYETKSVLFTLATTNIPNGTTFYHTLNNSSTATSTDFTTAVNGSIIVNGGTGTFVLTANNDADSSNETFQIDIRSGSTTGPIVISNNSVSIVPGLFNDLTQLGSNPTPYATFDDAARLNTLNSQYIWFKPDGTRMLVKANSAIYQYELSTAWDITTATYTKEIALTNGDRGWWVKEDGTKIFATENAGTIRQYNLSTAWDVATLTATTNANKGSQTRGLAISSDGLKGLLYEQGSIITNITLTTAWDLTTATLGSNVNNTLGNEFFVVYPDGKRLWEGKSGIEQRDLGTAWDITTGGTPSARFLDGPFTDIRGMYVTDGKAYVIDNGVIYAYSLPIL